MCIAELPRPPPAGHAARDTCACPSAISTVSRVTLGRSLVVKQCWAAQWAVAGQNSTEGGGRWQKERAERDGRGGPNNNSYVNFQKGMHMLRHATRGMQAMDGDELVLRRTSGTGPAHDWRPAQLRWHARGGACYALQQCCSGGSQAAHACVLCVLCLLRLLVLGGRQRAQQVVKAVPVVRERLLLCSRGSGSSMVATLATTAERDVSSLEAQRTAVVQRPQLGQPALPSRRGMSAAGLTAGTRAQHGLQRAAEGRATSQCKFLQRNSPPGCAINPSSPPASRRTWAYGPAAHCLLPALLRHLHIHEEKWTGRFHSHARR